MTWVFWLLVLVVFSWVMLSIPPLVALVVGFGIVFFFGWWENAKIRRG